jgi:diacylglycerol kinase (ATP)
MLVAANGSCAGGRVPLAPGADPCDGVLDLVVIEAVRPHSLAVLVPRVLAGRHASHPAVSTFRASSVRFESERPMWVNLDGDTWKCGPAVFDLIPGALRVATP